MWSVDFKDASFPETFLDLELNCVHMDIELSCLIAILNEKSILVSDRLTDVSDLLSRHESKIRVVVGLREAHLEAAVVWVRYLLSVQCQIVLAEHMFKLNLLAVGDSGTDVHVEFKLIVFAFFFNLNLLWPNLGFDFLDLELNERYCFLWVFLAFLVFEEDKLLF